MSSQTNNARDGTNALQKSSQVPLLLSGRETARVLSISLRTLARLTAAGSIPCVRIGRRLLFDPRDLTEFIDRRKQGAQCPAGREGGKP